MQSNKSNFQKIEKKNRHYTTDQLEKIERGKKRGKVKRGRNPVEF